MRYLFFAVSICLLSITALQAASKSNEVEFPRTAYQDNYKYYVLEEKKQNTTFVVTYKRAGFDSFVFGKVEINCPSRVIRSLGTSINSVKAIPMEPTPWIQPTIGTIEFDMISYVCR